MEFTAKELLVKGIWKAIMQYSCLDEYSVYLLESDLQEYDSFLFIFSLPLP
jgi:hypothetical protein